MDWVERFHDVVDDLARAVAERNRDRLTCRAGCAGCCVDELTVFEAEADVIRAHHGALLADGEPGPVGACAFLDGDLRCRIYDARPYVCRTQGLPLRWIEEDDEGPVELRDICPENLAGEPLEELPADALWTLGPFEERLLAHQTEAKGSQARVRLRDLFARRREVEPTDAEDGKRRLPILDRG